MKRLFLFVIMLSMAVVSYAQEGDVAAVNVNGYAEVELAPDLFTVSITITERDSKGRVSVDEQQRAMIKALKGAGIDTDNALKISDNSVDYYRRGTSLSTICYELKLSSAKDLNAAFRALEPLGLSSVNITKATYSRLDEAVVELRRQAIIDARAKASQLATAIGQGIGSCLYINDYNTSTHYNAAVMKSNRGRVYEEAAAGTDAVEVEPDLEFRSSKLTYNVQARFELLPLM